MKRSFTRRQAIQTIAGAGCGSLAVGLYAWRIEPHWLEFTHPILPISGLPTELEGRTLAHLSDLHIGPQVDDAYILDTFRRVQEMQPDFVVYTGDWITYRNSRQIAQLRRVITHAPHGKLGTIGILGNHDYGIDWRMLDVGDRVTEILSNAGISMLRNQAFTASGLQFLGLDDMWGPHFTPEKLLADKGRDPATIVLCHNPDAADKPVWGDYTGWMLAGHTHGGQCKPPFLPPPLLPVTNRKYVAGEIALSQGRRMYISRGVGHLLRVRFDVRPEVALFQLKRKV